MKVDDIIRFDLRTKLPETSAELRITLTVVCPNCDGDFDLFDILGLNDEGELFKAALPDGPWSGSAEHDSFTAEVDCTFCLQTILVKGINW